MPYQGFLLGERPATSGAHGGGRLLWPGGDDRALPETGGCHE